MGHIFHICLCNLSVHHRHLKRVTRSRGIFFSQHRSVDLHGPTLSRIMIWTEVGAIWWNSDDCVAPLEMLFPLVQTKRGSAEPDRVRHVNAQTNEVPQLIGVNYSETCKKIRLL